MNADDDHRPDARPSLAEQQRAAWRAYRWAQMEEAGRAWPVLGGVLAALLVAAWLAPAHRGWVLVAVGGVLAVWGAVCALRARPGERHGPAQVAARSHHLAVALGGGLVAALGVWVLGT